MSKLLVRPNGTSGKIHDVTPESAEWGYVGFAAHRLKAGESVSAATDSTEVILVMVEGKANISAAGEGYAEEFGELGDRMNVFEKTPPHCLYVPNGSEWSATATTDCTIGVCRAPGKGNYKAQRLGPNGINTETRGKGANTRHINVIAMEDRDVADSLLVTEVFTPTGNWSSYPPHRHDEDDFPRMTYLEETYYHRLNPPQGYAHQRVWTEDGSLDETMTVHDHDVVLVPKGHHPCGVPWGYELYYLNVMAGPLRKWRFQNHEEHDWIYERDNK